jgi:ubiquitin-protein ligase
MRFRARPRAVKKDADGRIVRKWIGFSERVVGVLPYRQEDVLRSLELAAAQAPTPRSFCDERILKEMQICVEAGFRAYAAVGSVREWRVYVRGPIPGTDHEQVFWALAISFPGDYPFIAPSFRFLSIPPLRNVSSFGRVRNRCIEEYHPRIHIAAILVSIQQLFYSSDPIGPYSQCSAEETVKWKGEEYDALIAAATVEPWLPLPDLDRLPFACGGILTGGSPLPPRRKKADLTFRRCSQISWKKIAGDPIAIGGVAVTQDETKYFAVG